MIQFLVEDEVSNYFDLLLNFVSNYPEVFKDRKQSSLSGNCFYTLNLLNHIETILDPFSHPHWMVSDL